MCEEEETQRSERAFAPARKRAIRSLRRRSDERTVGAAASRQDENSGATRQNRRESPRHPAGGFPFFGSLKTVLSFRKRKERTGFGPSLPLRRGTIATPFLLSLAKEETVLRAKEERRFWASFLLVQTDSALWKRCFRDFIDFATIARSAGAMILRVRDRASLRLKNAARWFCLQVVSAQRRGLV